MPNDTRNIIIRISAPELAAMLQAKAREMMPDTRLGQRLVIDSQSIPRFRSVRSEVMCEIDLKYHIEDIPEDASPEPLQPPRRKA